jgi:hypothetical protein
MILFHKHLIEFIKLSKLPNKLPFQNMKIIYSLHLQDLKYEEDSLIIKPKQSTIEFRDQTITTRCDLQWLLLLKIMEKMFSLSL